MLYIRQRFQDLFLAVRVGELYCDAGRQHNVTIVQDAALVHVNPTASETLACLPLAIPAHLVCQATSPFHGY